MRYILAVRVCGSKNSSIRSGCVSLSLLSSSISKLPHVYAAGWEIALGFAQFKKRIKFLADSNQRIPPIAPKQPMTVTTDSSPSRKSLRSRAAPKNYTEEHDEDPFVERESSRRPGKHLRSSENDTNAVYTPKRQSRLAVSSAAASASKTPSTLQLENLQIQTVSGSLLERLRAKKCNIASVSDDLIDSFSASSVYELVLLIYNAAASPFIDCSTFEAVTESDEAASVTEHLQRHLISLDKATFAETEQLLEGSGKEAKIFQKNFSSFWQLLVERSAGSILQSAPFLSVFYDWISPLTSCQFRPLRFASTIAMFSVISGFCETAIEAKHQLQQLSNLRASQKKQGKKITGARTEADCLRSRIDFCDENVTLLFNAIFVHRYRDVDVHLRSQAILFLCSWIEIYPSRFQDQSMIRYLSLQLADPKPEVRETVLDSMCRLVRQPEFQASFRLLLESCQTRIFEIALFDATPKVRCSSLDLIYELYDRSLLAESEFLSLKFLLFDVNPKVQRSAAPLISLMIQKEYGGTIAGIAHYLDDVSRAECADIVFQNLSDLLPELFSVDSLISGALDQSDAIAAVSLLFLGNIVAKKSSALSLNQLQLIANRFRSQIEAFEGVLLLLQRIDTQLFLENRSMLCDVFLKDIERCIVGTVNEKIIKRGVETLYRLKSDPIVAAIAGEEISQFLRDFLITPLQESFSRFSGSASDQMESLLFAFLSFSEFENLQSSWLVSFLEAQIAYLGPFPKIICYSFQSIFRSTLFQLDAQSGSHYMAVQQFFDLCSLFLRSENTLVVSCVLGLFVDMLIVSKSEFYPALRSAVLPCFNSHFQDAQQKPELLISYCKLFVHGYLSVGHEFANLLLLWMDYSDNENHAKILELSVEQAISRCDSSDSSAPSAISTSIITLYRYSEQKAVDVAKILARSFSDRRILFSEWLSAIQQRLLHCIANGELGFSICNVCAVLAKAMTAGDALAFGGAIDEILKEEKVTKSRNDLELINSLKRTLLQSTRTAGKRRTAIAEAPLIELPSDGGAAVHSEERDPIEDDNPFVSSPVLR